MLTKYGKMYKSERLKINVIKYAKIQEPKWKKPNKKTEKQLYKKWESARTQYHTLVNNMLGVFVWN